MPNFSTTEFIKSFKTLISRRENSSIIYLDNAKTFKAGAEWLDNINKDGHFLTVPNFSTTEFIKSFKRLISRRGSSNIIYLDNVKTFKTGAEWLDSINRDEQFYNFLITKKIIWKCNLSRALRREDSTNFK